MSKKAYTKEELSKTSKAYEEALEEDLDQLLNRSKEILVGAAVIGAGFWIAYKIFKSFTSNNGEGDHTPDKVPQDERSSEPGVMDIVKQTIMKELAIFLLGIIKEKVAEYVQNVAEKTDGEDSK